MAWGKLKPFWLSDSWKKSKEKGTGIFSWGDSDYFKVLDVFIPGAGSSIDKGLDQLASGSSDTDSPSLKDGINTASFISNNETVLYVLVGLVAYKVFLK